MLLSKGEFTTGSRKAVSEQAFETEDCKASIKRQCFGDWGLFVCGMDEQMKG